MGEVHAPYGVQVDEGENFSSQKSSPGKMQDPKQRNVPGYQCGPFARWWSFGPGGGGKSGEKWMDLEYSLKVLLTGVKDDFI